MLLLHTLQIPLNVNLTNCTNISATGSRTARCEDRNLALLNTNANEKILLLLGGREHESGAGIPYSTVPSLSLSPSFLQVKTSSFLFALWSVAHWPEEPRVACRLTTSRNLYLLSVTGKYFIHTTHKYISPGRPTTARTNGSVSSC